MEYVIKKGALTAHVDTRGAQLRALDFDGAAYLWPGGEEWGWSAPVCCPWCGIVEGGAFEHAGRSYAAGRHGFVRELEHRVVSQTDDTLSLALDIEEGNARWPWPFGLTASFAARESGLELSYVIANTGAETMPLQLGFHPAFLAPAGSRIVSQRPDMPGGRDVLELSPGLFDAGSLDMAAPESEWFRLERPDGRSVTVDAAGFTWFLLWGAPGKTPFACLEPWCGYPGAGDMFSRPDTVALEPGESFEKTLRIELK